jgi:hypothetical protein
VRLAAERKRDVEELLAEGRRLVEEVERLVCVPYDMPSDVTEEVVQRAQHGSVDSTA